MISNAHLIASTKLPLQWSSAAFALRRRVSWFALLKRCIQKATAPYSFSAGLVQVRFSALKNWFSELSLPGRFLFSSAGSLTNRLVPRLEPVRHMAGRARRLDRVLPVKAAAPNVTSGKALG